MWTDVRCNDENIYFAADKLAALLKAEDRLPYRATLMAKVPIDVQFAVADSIVSAMRHVWHAASAPTACYLCQPVTLHNSSKLHCHAIEIL